MATSTRLISTPSCPSSPVRVALKRAVTSEEKLSFAMVALTSALIFSPSSLMEARETSET